MEIKRVSPEQAKELLDAGEYIYLDVRTVAEFEAGHVPGAKNVPVFERDPSGRMQPNLHFAEIVEANFGKEAKCVVGCQMGGRSMQAVALLLSHGFADVVDMRGGLGGETDPMGNVTYPGWAPLGFPTTQKAHADDSYESLVRKII